MNGIDLSNNNSHADFDGVGFAFLKASEGTSFTDRTFAAWAQQAHDRNVTVGAYHFAHPDQHPATVEADYFTARRGDATLLALDIESRKGADPLALMGARALAAWVDGWCVRVRFSTGVTPYVYLNRYYLSKLATFMSAEWPVWLATLDGSKPTAYAERPVAIVQYAIEGGIDRNLAFVSLGGSPAAPPAPAKDFTVRFVYVQHKGHPEVFASAVGFEPTHVESFGDTEYAIKANGNSVFVDSPDATLTVVDGKGVSRKVQVVDDLGARLYRLPSAA